MRHRNSNCNRRMLKYTACLSSNLPLAIKWGLSWLWDLVSCPERSCNQNQDQPRNNYFYFLSQFNPKNKIIAALCQKNTTGLEQTAVSIHTSLREESLPHKGFSIGNGLGAGAVSLGIRVLLGRFHIACVYRVRYRPLHNCTLYWLSFQNSSQYYR